MCVVNALIMLVQSDRLVHADKWSSAILQFIRGMLNQTMDGLNGMVVSRDDITFIWGDPLQR